MGMKLGLFNHKLADVWTILSQTLGDSMEFQAVPEPDPAECGLLIRDATSGPVCGDVGVSAELWRRPMRIYISAASLNRVLLKTPDSLAISMELLDIDRLVAFGLPRAGTKRAIEVSPMLDHLRGLGFRSPRMSLDCTLHPGVTPIAMSLIYVKCRYVS
jgi:hypothetical protein